MSPGSQSLGPLFMIRETQEDNMETCYSSPKCNTSGPSNDTETGNQPSVMEHHTLEDQKGRVCVVWSRWRVSPSIYPLIISDMPKAF